MNLELKITDTAKEKMRFYLQDRDLSEWGVRIMVRMRNDYAFSLCELSKAEPTDIILEEGDIKILVDDISAPQLNECTVDFVDSELSSGFKVEPKPKSPIAEGAELDLENPQVKQVHDILVNDINPSIAAHGGFARLVGVKDNVVYLQMGGGCQGCGMATMTLRQGIETKIREAMPEIVDVVDETDHAAGASRDYQAN